jgi:hypothetical protein
MECLPVELQYCLLDALGEVDPSGILALSRTCRTFEETVEAWLTTKTARSRLFREVVVPPIWIVYLASRPNCKWCFPLAFEEGVF